MSEIPLAEKLRPKKLDEVIGQEQLLHPKNGSLKQFINQKRVPSLIFWGPPGTGKTTLGKIISQELGYNFHLMSAVFAGVSDLKKIFAEAENSLQKTILFLDEIHRFNKLQQDSLLGATEIGSIILIGATTENPSFSINNALLSRVQVFVLNSLSHSELEILVNRVEEHLEVKFPFEPDAKEKLFQLADGDGRKIISILEKIHLTKFQSKEKPETISKETLIELIHSHLRYDKSDDEHYNLISALHKSLRGSDCDASLYWAARMLAGGEDPHYIFRRLLRFAYEDVGLADPEAAVYTLNAWQTFERLGSPEGEIALAQTVIYLALAPKSNKVYQALNQVRPMITESGSLPPPKHILNAPTSLMKELDYGKGYQYDHDQKDSFSGQNYFPEEFSTRPSFYQPVNRGFEREMIKRLQYFNQLREQKKN